MLRYVQRSIAHCTSLQPVIMTFEPHPVRVTSPQKDDERSDLKNEELTPKTNHQPHIIAKDEPILCPHCLRTASNGIKCKGICVAESDY